MSMGVECRDCLYYNMERSVCTLTGATQSPAACCDRYVRAPGVVLNSQDTGVKYDGDKPRWELLMEHLGPEVESVVRVLTHGAAKYPSDDNWKHVEPLRGRYLGALMRHVVAWAGGEVTDPESGEPHLAHAVCCALFMMWGDARDGR